MASPVRHATRGFTLLELLVVIAIIAIATAGVTLSLRDSGADALERDASRLAAMLEAGRAQSRATGLPVTWQASTGGFVLHGSTQQGEQTWLSAGIQAKVQQPAGNSLLVLGPEPILPAQAVLLMLDQSRLVVSSDGLAPFKVQAETPAL